jgi:SnoaL-like domain
MTESREPSLEQRLRKVEDTLAIYRLIASHPPAADTGTGAYYRNAFAADGTIDLGGGKGATGNDAIAAIVSTPAHQAAIAGGLCHFAGLPYVEVNGDTAVAVSYLQIISPDRDSVPKELSGHGVSTGFRIHRAGANVWELARTKDGWKVTRRKLRPLDGSQEARDLLRTTFATRNDAPQRRD